MDDCKIATLQSMIQEVLLRHKPTTGVTVKAKLVGQDGIQVDFFDSNGEKYHLYPLLKRLLK